VYPEYIDRLRGRQLLRLRAKRDDQLELADRDLLKRSYP